MRTRKRGKTFSYIFEAGKKADGKRKVVEKGGFATKKAAYDAGVAAYTDWKHGNIGITSDNILLKDFLQNWLEKVVALNVKANYIKVPKKAPTNIVKRHIITPEKLNELLEKYPFGSPYYMPILILFCTGVRIGELLGLTWDNIDLDKKIITLDKQVVYVSKRGYFFTTLKTWSSNRYIVY